MPVVPSLASKVAALPPVRTGPLWHGPQAEGPFGGVTQSMLVRFLSCRERFRVRYVEGLQPPDAWNKTIGYGNMWHTCEEAHAANKPFLQPLIDHANQQGAKYPLQREEITKWFSVCCVQFPEYVKYWSQHPDVLNRTPLMQEQVFDVPYTLPSGRVVRLRGKFDSVDPIEEQVTEFGNTFQRRGIYLQENKSKGDIDPMQLERQLKFDLQTMLYLVGLEAWINEHCQDDPGLGEQFGDPVRGVRYNVVRRPLSGGIGSIKPHKATKKEPAETGPQFYERLRRDYIAADPAYWFFRIRSEVSAKDIMEFRTTCLDPVLENLCWWYDTVVKYPNKPRHVPLDYPPPPSHWRHPFGVYNALEEGRATEYDSYLANGSTAGLRKTDVLFPELEVTA